MHSTFKTIGVENKEISLSTGKNARLAGNGKLKEKSAQLFMSQKVK